LSSSTRIRYFFVPHNSHQSWDLKWSKSMGTWAWALLMCPRDPNHCKVGRVGSQSYFVVSWLSFFASRCLMCVLVHYAVVTVACVMFVIVLRRKVECIYYPCTHVQTPKTKIKIALVIWGYCCTKWEVCHSLSVFSQNIDYRFQIISLCNTGKNSFGFFLAEVD